MKTAIIGCGGVAAVHAACLSSMNEVKQTCFVDIKIERAEAFAKQYGGTYCRSIEEALEKDDIQVVHICTPHYLHVPMAIEALKKGKHVYLEKPAAINFTEYKQLKEIVQTVHTQCGISYQNRFNPSVRKAKQMITSGQAGKVRGGRAFVSWDRSANYYTESDWRGKLSTEGGGVLINQAGHTLDLLTQFLGKPVEVEAVLANHHLKHIIEVEDMMEAYIHYKNQDGDCYGCFYATTAFCDNRPPLLEIICENFIIRIEELSLLLLYPDGTQEQIEVPKERGLGKSYWGAGHKDCISEFYRCITKGEPFSLNLEKTDYSNRLILSMYQSAREGGVVLC